MAFTIPQIVKSAERFMAELERAVARFPRAHRYTLGADLRVNAMQVARLAHRAWRSRNATLDELSDAIDDLKLRLQLGQQVKAFVSFAQFEAVSQNDCYNFIVIHCGLNGRNHNDTRLYDQEASASVTLRPAHCDRQRQGRLALPLRLWHRESRACSMPEDGRDSILRMLCARGPLATADARHVENADLSTVGVDDGSLLPEECSQLSVLRRARHSRLRAMAYVRELLCRHGRAATGTQPRSLPKQRRQLRAWQLPMGEAHRAESQHEAQSAADVERRHGQRCRMVGAHGAFTADHCESPETRQVSRGSARRLDREQLVTWRGEIEHFLSERLRLALQPDDKLKPLGAGIDFLGYVIYPTHIVVRRRVVAHAREKFDRWALQHVAGETVMADEPEREQLRSVCASYAGHFRHANSWRLRRHLRARYPWLRQALKR